MPESDSRSDALEVNAEVRAPRRPRRLLSAFLGVVVVAAAVLGSLWMFRNPVRARRRKPKPHATVVQITPVTFSNHRVKIAAMGVISAAEQVAIQPRIKGEVLSIGKDFIPGGRVTKGEVLLRIDPEDYRVAKKQAAASLAQAKADLELERGRQASVRRELKLVGNTTKGINKDLVLRGPQLRKAEASVATARATLERANLDVRRSVLRSPINAIVLSRDVNVGTRVTEATRLAQLVGTDAFWVELLVPVNQLRWLQIPRSRDEKGSMVVLRDATWKRGETRQGRVLRLAPDLEKQGRMARLIVEIVDPLALEEQSRGQPRFLIGSWIEASVEGSELTSVAVLPRRLVHDGDKVWLLDGEGRLVIRRVVIAFRGKEKVFVSKGLTAADQLIASDIATPVAGMALREEGARAATKTAGKRPRGKATHRRPRAKNAGKVGEAQP